MQKEQKRTGTVLPQRALKLFGRLKNIDERIRETHKYDKKFVVEMGKTSKTPGYAVRLLKVKENNDVVLKFPTLASYHFNVTPKEEIKFVRKAVELVNARLANQMFNQGFVILKPIGHAVGPFIAMRRTNLPTIADFEAERLTPKARRMLFRLAKELQLPQEAVKAKILEIAKLIDLSEFNVLDNKELALSKKYPADPWIENANKISFPLKPLESRHLQIVGQKDGVIQLVPYIDAI